MIFKRKNLERPKNRLGLALFKYDNLFSKDLQKIIQSIRLQKPINNKKAAIIIDGVFYKLDAMAEDISRENFKTDYRSDKTRDVILVLFRDLKELLSSLRFNSFDYTNPLLFQSGAKFSLIVDLRESLKNKMKDIGSDYQ